MTDQPHPDKLHRGHDFGNLPVGFEIHPDLIQNCEEVIEYLDAKQLWRSSVQIIDSLSVVDDKRTSATAFVNMFDFRNPECIYRMNKSVWENINDYASHWQVSFSDIEPFSVQRYEIGQQYGFHSDDGPQHHRVISGLVYLNTVDEGGETYFPEFDLKIKPQQGTLVVFPSNFIYRHAALPPISGEKYAAAYWANG